MQQPGEALSADDSIELRPLGDHQAYAGGADVDDLVTEIGLAQLEADIERQTELPDDAGEDNALAGRRGPMAQHRKPLTGEMAEPHGIEVHHIVAEQLLVLRTLGLAQPAPVAPQGALANGLQIERAEHDIAETTVA